MSNVATVSRVVSYDDVEQCLTDALPHLCTEATRAVGAGAPQRVWCRELRGGIRRWALSQCTGDQAEDEYWAGLLMWIGHASDHDLLLFADWRLALAEEADRGNAGLTPGEELAVATTAFLRSKDAGASVEELAVHARRVWLAYRRLVAIRSAA